MFIKFIKLGLIACFSLVLGYFAYVGTNSRLMADEYCSAAVVQQQGFFQAQQHWYTTWSGRFSATFLDSVTGLLGPAANSLAPLLVVSLWVLVLLWAARRLGYGWIDSLLLATLLSALVLRSTPNVGESFYWSQGMHSVLPPLVLLPVVLLSPWPWLAGLVAFIAGGFGETYSAIQLTILVLLLLYFWRDLPKRRLFLAGLVGGLLAFTITALAPGNAFRRAALPPPPGLVEYLNLLAGSIWGYLSQTFTRYWLLLAGVLIMGVTLPMPFQLDKKIMRWAPASVPIFFLAILLISFIPGVYILHEGLPGRTQIIPHFFLILCLFVWGQILGALIPAHLAQVRARWALAAAVAILVLVSIQGALAVRQSQVEFKPYARRWDKNNQLLIETRKNGSPSINLPYNFNPLMNERVLWIDDCMVDYYQIKIERP